MDPFCLDTSKPNYIWNAGAEKALFGKSSSHSHSLIISNYGDPNVTSVNPFPIYYPRSLANVPTSQWDFQYIPDAVVINLGTNDYSTQPQPPADIFVPGNYPYRKT